MATKSTGFNVPCPLCGATEGLILTLNDLVLSCTECNEEVTVANLQSLVAETQRLIRWLAAAGTV